LHCAAFTLAEVLAALALMAIVIPVVVQGLKIASLAGELSQRKAMALRVAERVLNEAIVAGQWNGVQSGTDQSGPYPFKWSIRNEPWSALSSALAVSTPAGVDQNFVNQNNLKLLSVDVTFGAQDKSYKVQLSTVADVSRQVTVSPPPEMTTQ
jgi:prepilin-type N-terminal cleavage/methylation domain-containing protein